MNSRIGLSVLAAVAGAAFADQTFGTTYPLGELMVGFTSIIGPTHTITPGASDVVFDLGQESALTSGASWNVSALLGGIDVAGGNVEWGVLGIGTAGGTHFSMTYDPSIDYNSAIGAIPPNPGAYLSGMYTGIKSIYQSMPAAGAGNSFSIVNSTNTGNLSSSISWSYETIVGTGSQGSNTFKHNYGTSSGYFPDINWIGVDNSVGFYHVPQNSPAASLVGYFSLSDSGILSFNTTPIPAPASAGLLASACAVMGVRRRRSTHV